jgi:hypothetical protein
MFARNLKLKLENGFTTVVVMGMMLVGMLLVAAAFASSDGDTSAARHDQYYKEAYNAADAGINWYFYHLTQDANYWSQCANMGKPVWRKNDPNMSFYNIPGSEAQFEIEILPAPGQTACTTGVSTSVVDPSSGAFKVRSTGNYRGVHRTIVATFRRVGFLNFLYFTDLETLDPVTAGNAQAQQQATAACSHYYYQSPRDQNICSDPAFISQDVIDGPMHTNDQLYICGHPTFGHQATDHVEDSDPNAPGYRTDSSCGSSSPNTPGNNFKYKAPILTLPPSNASLKDDADSNYVFTGTTHIVLSGNTMTVNGGASKPLPSNGVIYVQNQNCTPQYDSTMDYPAVTDGTGCGDVYVRSTSNVTSDLTIGADNDIIIDGNVTHGPGVEVGLIANNFVRVYHPIDRSKSCTVNGMGNSPANASSSPEDPTQGSMTNPTIDAAILAINHSFIVDNWACGGSLGNLTVSGAIAQKYRGTVGTHSGNTIATGYAKAYSYDYELRYHQPPYFLDPVQAGWGILQETEQVPPAH